MNLFLPSLHRVWFFFCLSILFAGTLPAEEKQGTSVISRLGERDFTFFIPHGFTPNTEAMVRFEDNDSKILFEYAKYSISTTSFPLVIISASIYPDALGTIGTQDFETIKRESTKQMQEGLKALTESNAHLQGNDLLSPDDIYSVFSEDDRHFATIVPTMAARAGGEQSLYQFTVNMAIHVDGMLVNIMHIISGTDITEEMIIDLKDQALRSKDQFLRDNMIESK
ncbi:MAG: hypothetical protein LUE17_08460 [Planctomycetaceae bacterium]|nr:hypothetical protein [Planctomycetaceae bacterium]